MVSVTTTIVFISGNVVKESSGLSNHVVNFYQST